MTSHNKKRGSDISGPLKILQHQTLLHGGRLRFAQRQNDGDSRSDIGNENSNQQANNPLEIAVDSILDISETVVQIYHLRVNPGRILDHIRKHSSEAYAWIMEKE